VGHPGAQHRDPRRLARLLVPIAACASISLLGAAGARAQIAGEDGRWALYGQVTSVTQHHASFRSPYQGPNSLDAFRQTAETVDLTLYAGARLWRGGELWINPEIDQGFGLSNTLGVAGFPSGEAYKVGANRPYPRLPRVFLRHTIALDGADEKTEAGPNRLGGNEPANNVTLTIGKFGVPDVFDNNRYAHDPRVDFLNWSIIESGAFDYAADAWGFTYGAAIEWNQGPWSWRGGIFQMSPAPNGKVIAPDLRQHMWVIEAEHRHHLGELAGSISALAFVNHARMGSYREAVDLAARTGDTPDTAAVRRVANNPGFAVDVEQSLTGDLAAFMRGSVNGGRKEAYEFTEINRSLAAGLALEGRAWARPDDTLAAAFSINGLTRDARSYFSAGGLGILIGDGRLNYGNERILETYYSWQIERHLALTVDFQHIAHPAYNRDRGPVSVYGLRVRAAF